MTVSGTHFLTHQDGEQFYVLFRMRQKSEGSMELVNADGNDNTGPWEAFYVMTRKAPQTHDSPPCVICPRPLQTPFPIGQTDDCTGHPLYISSEHGAD